MCVQLGRKQEATEYVVEESHVVGHVRSPSASQDLESRAA